MTRTIGPIRLARLLGTFDHSPAYRGLCGALQTLIGDARLSTGVRLPSERQLAGTLGLSRTTVARAYADLVAAGFATARQGSGTYTTVPDARRHAHAGALRPLNMPGLIDLHYAASAAVPGTMAACERALKLLPSYLATDGYFSSGLPELRALIAESFDARGLPTVAEQIVITSGALPATAVVARALSSAGDRIMIESPVFPNAMTALRLGGGSLVCSPLADPLGDTCWDLEGIDATLRQSAPRLAYLIPDFQNPTGFLMSDEDRARYAGMLRKARCVAIIDEILQPANLSGVPMPAPFAAHAPDAITIGSASKIFWGGLRVGWIRAPRALVEPILTARVSVDLASSLFDQLVLSELLRMDGVLTARRKQLRQRRDVLVQTLREHLPHWRFRLPDGGLALWVRLPHGSATDLAAAMEKRNIRLVPGPVFAVEGGFDAWVRIPHTLPEERIVEGVQRMAEYWDPDAFDTAVETKTSPPLSL